MPNADDDPPVESVEKRRIDPHDLVKSDYYYGDENNVTRHFSDSIDNQGPLAPVLVRVEDGELAYFEGGKRVEQAREYDKQVPVYICDEEWTPEKIMTVQLYENTDALSSTMNKFRLAWCLEDLWAEMDKPQKKLSPGPIAEKLDVSGRTARRYIEPIRHCWSDTTIDREILENEQIRRAAENDKYIINDLTVEEAHNLVSYARLEDIRKISDPRNDLAETQELERFSDDELRKRLLAGYIRKQRSEANEGISPAELRRIKNLIKDENMMPPEAVNQVLHSSKTTLEPTIEGNAAEQIKAAAKKKSVTPTQFITDSTEQYLQNEGYTESLQNDRADSNTAGDEYMGQLDYLDQHVDRSRTEPKLYLNDNSGLPEIGDTSIALTVTSPPYNLGKDYGAGVDDNRNYFEGYLAETIAQTFIDVYDATVPGGYLCINIPIVVNSYSAKIPKNRFVSSDVKRVLVDGWSPTEHLAFSQLQEQTDWQFHHPVIWEKGYSTAAFSPQEDWEYPPQQDLNTTCEAVLVFKKPGERKISEQRKQQSKVYWKNNTDDSDLRDMKWSIPPSQWEPQHVESYVPTFPEELVRRCILWWSFVGDAVLDPFAGRGTTLKVAKRLYRKSIGYEIQEELERDIREYVGMD